MFEILLIIFKYNVIFGAGVAVSTFTSRDTHNISDAILIALFGPIIIITMFLVDCKLALDKEFHARRRYKKLLKEPAARPN
jgi:hypothetical protein